MLYGDPFKSWFPVFMGLENFMIVMSSFSIIFMLIFSVNMASKNTSFSETRNIKEIFGNEGLFNVGTLNNLKMILGDNVWDWWLPATKIKRSCNGIDFPLRDGIN